MIFRSLQCLAYQYIYIYIYNNAIPTLIRRLGLSYSRKKKPDAHNTRRMMFCSSIALMIPMIVYVYVYVYICIYIDSFDNWCMATVTQLQATLRVQNFQGITLSRTGLSEILNDCIDTWKSCLHQVRDLRYKAASKSRLTNAMIVWRCEEGMMWHTTV